MAIDTKKFIKTPGGAKAKPIKGGSAKPTAKPLGGPKLNTGGAKAKAKAGAAKPKKSKAGGAPPTPGGGGTKVKVGKKSYSEKYAKYYVKKKAG
jgi:hypothetical protein